MCVLVCLLATKIDVAREREREREGGGEGGRERENVLIQLYVGINNGRQPYRIVVNDIIIHH